MKKIKALFTSVRFITLLIFVVLAVVAINPGLNVEGVAIRNVESNSSAALAGIVSPEPTDPPRSRELVTAINGVRVNTPEEFYEKVAEIGPNVTYTVATNRQVYRLISKPKVISTELNETERRVFEEIILTNETIDGTITEVQTKVNVTRVVPKVKTEIVGSEPSGLTVYEAPTTNVRQGIDLTGGTRVLLQPEEKLDDGEMEILVLSMKQRLNVFGLSDVSVRPASDLSGNQFVVVEIAGANEEEVKDLLAKQGKFEAKIGDQVVFRGGQDITFVCRSADCSGLDPFRPCQQHDGGASCSFTFQITLSQEAAERQAAATRDLEIITDAATGGHSGGGYLSEQLRLILDDSEVNALNIGASLRGSASTNIQISGGSSGITVDQARTNALDEMKQLQTILITGSLPVKLTIVKTDSISPTLGKEFVWNALIVGLYSILAVAIVVFIRFRKWQVAVPMAGAMLAELGLILGTASLIGWNIDLAAIAGIIVAIGTGVDDQIVITDETLRGENVSHNWKKKLKNAFFIIVAAYLTTVAAMFPLLFAGAGLLKGFAITTLIGITFGVLVTRPAYAAVVEILLKD